MIEFATPTRTDGFLRNRDGSLPFALPDLSEFPGFSVEEVRVAGNRGSCGGVENTLQVVDLLMEIVPKDVPIWTNNTPVNFPRAFEQYGERLISVAGDMSKVPDGAVFLVSAHSAPPEMLEEAERRNMSVVDTSCPYVLDEQEKVRGAEKDGVHTVFLGEEDHPETVGVKGQVDPGSITIVDPRKGIGDIVIPDHSRVFAKTTYSPSEIDEGIRQLRVLNPTIDASKAHSCYALRNRHMAGEQLVRQVDFWLVVGDRSSHNSRGLTRIGVSRSIPAALITGPEDIDWSWFGPQHKVLGVSSGASVPDRFTQTVLQPFRDLEIPVIEIPKAVPEAYRVFTTPNSRTQIAVLRQRFST